MPTAAEVGALAAASHTTRALTVTYEDGTSETVTLVVTK
jgi:VCBS repeat-containing protein